MISGQLFGGMAALADPVRGRVLRVLEGHELAVGELCAVFQLPQSSMSRHLKVLHEEGWLVWRAEGTSRQYRMAAFDRGDARARLWAVVREQVDLLPAVEGDDRRVRSVLGQRILRSREFFSSAAGEWDRLREDQFGTIFGLQGLLGLLDPRWTVGDLGCGTGQASAALAPFVERVIAVDASPEMLEGARRRLEGVTNVEVRSGELEALPIDAETLDAAVLFLVLPYLADPRLVLGEVARVVRAGGCVLIVDLLPHDREEYRQRMGHLWPGFSAEQVQGWLRGAGMVDFRHVPLPPDPEAKGPGLFAARARLR